MCPPLPTESLSERLPTHPTSSPGHVAPEEKRQAERSLVGAIWDVLPLESGAWCRWELCGIVGGSLMCVHDCDCHQLPDFPVICSEPRLTQRRNCSLAPESVVLDPDFSRG